MRGYISAVIRRIVGAISYTGLKRAAEGPVSLRYLRVTKSFRVPRNNLN